MSDSVKYNETGPFFDGTAAKAAEDYCLAVEQEVADAGVTAVRQALGSVLRNPTGYYESRIQVEMVNQDQAVTDGGVVYGPWLEGVGSRNSSSRFKGYHTFRKVKQELEAKAVTIAENVLPPFLDRMN